MKRLSLAALCLLSLSLQGHIPLPWAIRNEQLMVAVMKNDIEQAKKCLEEGADPNFARTTIPFSESKVYAYPMKNGRFVATIKGKVINAPCLLVALCQENIQMIQLLAQYSPVDAKESMVTFEGVETVEYKEFPSKGQRKPVTFNHNFTRSIREFAHFMVTMFEWRPKQETIDFLSPITYEDQTLPVEPFVPNPRDRMMPMVY